ncbi:hypothetical protein [Methylomonas methanica]|uniref:Uncharacterized protein n=1 Tax=Methylomonas methanica (strain DSM 25384 / MC09) TaxID=857087 RepID=G0A2V0_METMM|nr:hypothetical protein [Methylomonas methanica]AEG01453.1 hypothetical protein Metme_3075 [Methylomonas methanica MC09]
MKALTFTFIVGAVFLYFINIAILKTPILDLEWSIHAATRFLVGFFVLGISYFYAKALSFKNAIKLTFVIIILDYLYDYFIGTYRLNFEIIMHGIYMLVWGALLGYLTARRLKKNR